MTVRADTQPAVADLHRAQGPIRSAIGLIASTAAGVLGAMGISAGIGKMLSMGRDVVAEAEQATQAEAKVAAVVKATGMAAGFTSEQLIAQAAALQKVTTSSDETIMGMQAVMLTFRKVQGKTFEEAIEAALDIGEVLGSAQGAALQLGKALEDPIRGVQALRRSGVSFSEQQREQIADLVRSGQLQKAQALVLGEVRKQLGGVAREMAKTEPGKIKVLNNDISNVKETIGGKLLPLIRQWKESQLGLWESFSEALPGIEVFFRLMRNMVGSTAGHWMDAFTDAFNWIQGLPKKLAEAFGFDFFTPFAKSLDSMLGSWEGFGEGLMTGMNQIGASFHALWVQIATELKLDLDQLLLSVVRGFVSVPQAMAEGMLRARAWFGGWSEEMTETAVEAARQDIAAKFTIIHSIEAEMKDIQADYEARMVKIGEASLNFSKQWRQTMGRLPRVSSAVADILAEIGARPPVKKPGVPGPGGEEGVMGKEQTWGRMQIPELGRKIQDAVLQRKDPILAENKKQTEVLTRMEKLDQKIHEDLTKMIGPNLFGLAGPGGE